MADVFQPKFVDLVRNLTTTTGTSDFLLGPPVNGFTSLLAECQAGDSFYYSAIGIDRPGEREVGRGTLLAGGVIRRDPTDGTKTNFSAGTKVVAIIAAAEWFARIEAGGSAASRSALAASSSSQGGILLREAGREGQFVWDGSNLAALVGADPAQGIYVAPASDPSGASGAWVRRYSGPISVKWFGAKGDGVASDGAAFVAAIAFLKASALNDVSGYYKGSSRLFVPARTYNLGATTIDITHTLIIEGEGSGMYGGHATMLKWSGATGIRVQDSSTAGAAGTQAEGSGTTYSGAGTMIRGLALIGGYTGAEAECHGIHLRTRAILEDVYIEHFEGDGIHIVATAPANGNANVFQINRARIQNCRNGVFCDSADANAGTGIGLDIGSCRQWGIWDSSFLGNSWIGCQVDACGIVVGTYMPCTVSHGGSWYSCVVGQEAGASTNAPSGTSADNQWWAHISSGAPSTTSFNVPAWTSGATYRSGGSYCADNPNNGGRFVGCYAEGGQGPSQVYGSCLADGANIGRIVGAQAFGSNGNLATYSGLAVLGRASGGTVRTVFGGGETRADGIMVHFNAAQLATPGMTWGWSPIDTGVLHWTNWRDYFGADYCPFQISTDAASAPWGKNLMNFPAGYGLGGKKVRSGTQAPTTGAYAVGDMVFNSAPSAGGKVGWVCTGAGSPGTWKAFGAIDA